MSDQRSVRLQLHPASSQVVIDGVDFADALKAIVLRHDAKSRTPTLELDLQLVCVDADVEVIVPDATCAALVELGWTPPGGEREGP